MSLSLSNLVVAAQEQTRELPLSPYAFGAMAFFSFMALLAILWSFRGTAQRLAAGGGPHGSDYQGEPRAGRAATADQHGSHP